MADTKLGVLADHCADSTTRDRRNSSHMARMSLVWSVLFVGGIKLIDTGVVEGPAAWLVAALPSVAAAFLIHAFVRFLREADELQRSIQLKALALGFAGGFFVIFGYSPFHALGAPAIEAVMLAVVMPLLYVVGVMVGRRRYR